MCGLVLLLCACHSLPSLATPKLVKVDQTTLVLSWHEVNDARGYVVKIDDKEVEVRTNQYSLASLKAGKYTLRVKSRGDGETNSDSAWSAAVTFEREQETGLTFKLIQGNSAYEVVGMGSATGDVTIPDTYRGKPVTSIGENAFSNKRALTKITLGSNVENINHHAFYGCPSLTEVVLQEGLLTIGSNAFQSCVALTSISIPSTVRYIGQYAFSYCSAMENLTIADGVSTLYDYAFLLCTSLKSVTIPDSVVSIGSRAFSECSNVTTVSIGKGLKNLGSGAFWSCTALTNLTIGPNVETIGDSAFAGCVGLTRITLPSTVKSLGSKVFANCTELATVDLNDEITSIGSDAFYNTLLWNAQETFVYVDGWLVNCKEKEVEGNIVVEDGTVGIANKALAGVKSFTRLTTPDSVKYIGDGALNGCSDTMELLLGAVREIGASAFANCTSLSTVRLGNSLEKMGNYAFYKCELLMDIIIPDSVEQIGQQAFTGSGLFNNASGLVYADKWVVGFNGSLDTMCDVQDGTVGIADYAFTRSTSMLLNVPSSVKYIGIGAFYQARFIQINLANGIEAISDYTFYGCANLGKLDIPKSVKSIGYAAFYGCQSLTEFVIPDNVQTVGAYAFGKCIQLNSITIGNGVTSLGVNAFKNCTALATVKFGSGLTKIDDQTFYKCEALEKVYIGVNMTEIGEYAFFKCTKLSSISFPQAVKKIDQYAFYGCSGLSSINFGDGVSEIGNFAFYGCSALASVFFPDNIKSIGKYAFRKCDSLTSVVLGSQIDSLDAHVFNGNLNITFYVESKAVPDGWNIRWNSSYRPVFLGVTLSEDRTYVVSFVKSKGSILNPLALNGISDPYRKEMKFAGWATKKGGNAVYTSETVVDAPDGTTLYAIYE